MKAGDIMSRDVITIKKDASIEELADLLTQNKISGVPVVDDENRVIGIVSQKDLLYKDMEPRFPAVFELLGGLIFFNSVRQYNEDLRKLVATTVEGIMNTKVVTVDEDTGIDKIARLMVDRDINRVPVLRNGVLVGIVTRADIIRYLGTAGV